MQKKCHRDALLYMKKIWQVNDLPYDVSYSKNAPVLPELLANVLYFGFQV